MKGQAILFSKGKDDWRTPKALFNQLNAEFDFRLDVAADASNHLCEAWYGPGSPLEEDALLAKRWGQVNWCNPPYSKVKEFVAKAYMEMRFGRKTVMLIPSRTDTKWFHAYIYRQGGVEIRFLKGRVKFVTDPPSKHSAPFPSMIVVFG